MTIKSDFEEAAFRSIKAFDANSKALQLQGFLRAIGRVKRGDISIRSLSIYLYFSAKAAASKALKSGMAAII